MSMPPEAWAAALATLPGMGPARHLALLRTWPPSEAWQHVLDRSWLQRPEVAGTARSDPVTLAGAWAQAAATIDVAARGVDMWRQASASLRSARRRIQRRCPTTSNHRPRCSTAAIRAYLRSAVAIVGTRSATRYGLDIAYELGFALAEAGVAVVSGFALGIEALRMRRARVHDERADCSGRQWPRCRVSEEACRPCGASSASWCRVE